MHRFIPVIASELGFQVGETPIVSRAENMVNQNTNQPKF